MKATAVTVSNESKPNNSIRAIDAGGADAAPGDHRRFLAAYAAHARADDAQAAPKPRQLGSR